MLFYLIFSPFYKIPKSASGESLGYGYNLNEREFCEEIALKNPCNGVEDKEDCLGVFNKMELCVKSMDVWLHSVNQSCFDQINALELCIDEQKNCRTEFVKLQKCEAELPRPEWLKDEYFKHWNRFTKATKL